MKFLRSILIVSCLLVLSVGLAAAQKETTVLPSNDVLDDFNRADGRIGGNWAGNKSKYRISDNQLRVRSNDSNSAIYWKEAFGPDQEAFVKFAHINETATEQNLLLKAQSKHTWGDGVIEVLYDAPGHNVQVWTWKWPQGWVKYGDDIPVTFLVGDTFGARAKPDGTVEIYRNGDLLGTRDVTGWSHYDKGGHIGLWFISAKNTRLDDFGGGTVPESAAGTIVINKVTAPSGGTGFGFTDNISAPNNFSLSDGESITFTNIEAGTYTVTEDDTYDPSDPDVYILTDLVCVDSDGEGTTSTVDLISRTATINLDSGETVECTYTNSQFGKFRIIKDTVPDSAQDFTFTITELGFKTFTLDDDNVGPPYNIFAFVELLPGTYTVTEDDSSDLGYALTDLVCVDSDETGTTSTVDLSSCTTTINLDPGETVECTYTNTLQFGLIRIIKDTVPDSPQDFGFTTTGLGLSNFILDDDNVGPPYNILAFGEVFPGTYTVTEDDPGGLGYALTDLICVDSDGTGTASTVDLISRTATINLDPRETVECTFTNAQQPD